MFLLTEGPHIFYVDPINMELKGKIPFCRKLRVEAKNFRTFFVHTVCHFCMFFLFLNKEKKEDSYY